RLAGARRFLYRRQHDAHGPGVAASAYRDDQEGLERAFRNGTISVMDCCQCKGIETLFDQKEAKKRLKAYRKDGAAKTTRMLIEALQAEGIKGMTLLDIGGGVGAIQHDLLRAGIERATDVDASAAYVKAAQNEAERQGHADRVSYYH